MHNPAISADRHIPGAASIKPFIDIVIVFGLSALAFAAEDLARSQAWITPGAESRGVSAVLVGAIAAVSIVLLRGGTFADLGFKRPTRWAMVPLQVAAIVAAFIAMQDLAPLLVSSFTSVPQPDLSQYDSIKGNAGAAIALALILPITASIPEEVIYRGFLMDRLSRMFGTSATGVVITIMVQALIFGSVHFGWGIGGMIVTVMMGMVWGTAYLLVGRNLWVVILAHSMAHILFAIQLYLNTSIVI
jgi:membrane protease YdiL (CAAX protease family)